MDLQTTYMGLPLKSPIVVSACTLSEEIDNILKMEDAEAGAVVLFSLFEEQIRREAAAFSAIEEATSNTFPEALDFFPGIGDFHVGTEKYLEIIRRAKERVNIPVIASLNGITDDGWITYARQMQQAGADGIEINVYYLPSDLDLRGDEVEARYVNIVRRVKSCVSIPVAVKLNPYFSAMGNMAMILSELAGADALVLFNRFYQPDLDIERLRAISTLQFSSPSEIRLPLLWMGVLYNRIKASLAATTGVHSATEVIKYLLAGADITMTASSLYLHGIGHLSTLRAGLIEWMTRMEFSSVHQFRGLLSQQHLKDPTAYQRANYLRVMESLPM